MAEMQLAAVLAYTLAFAALLLWVPWSAWRHRPLPRDALRAGLWFSVGVLLLQLPGVAATALHFDPRPMLDELPDPLVASLSETVTRVALGASLASAALFFAWRILLVPVAEQVGSAWPVLRGAARPDRGHALAFGGAAGLGALSALAPFALGLPSGVDAAWPLYPTLPDAWRPALALGTAAAAALTEEAALRGVLQRHLAVRLGAWAIPLVAGLGSLAQALSADPVAMVRSLGVGLGCGALAHRFTVEHAVLAHLGYNVALAALT